MDEGGKGVWWSEQVVAGYVLVADVVFDRRADWEGFRVSLSWRVTRHDPPFLDVPGQPIFVPSTGELVRISRRSGRGFFVTGSLSVKRRGSLQLLWGDLHFGNADESGACEGGLWEVRGAPDPPEPCPAPTPDPDPIPVPPPSDSSALLPPIADVETEGGRLFPYLFLRDWIELCSPPEGEGFLRYAPDPPRPDSLIAALRRTDPGARTEIDRLVAEFLRSGRHGSSRFLDGVDDLPPPMDAYSDLMLEALAEGTTAGPAFVALAVRCTGKDVDDLVAFVASSASRDTVDDAWQTITALVLVSGCRTLWVEELTRVLVADAVLRTLLTASTPENVDIASLLDARVVMPLRFPERAVSSLPSAGEVEVFAVGDLLCVHHGRVTYRLGEIATLESVFPGERRERVRRSLRRTEESSRESTDRRSESGTSDDQQRRDLRQEISRAVADDSVSVKYDDFSTSYGPPTQVKLKNGWTRAITPGKRPQREDRIDYGRALVHRAVERVTERVRRERALSVLEESERRETSLIDNSTGASALVAAERWLDKQYRLRIRNEGVRLVIRFVIPTPGQELRTGLEAIDGVCLGPPEGLDGLGIRSFEDVNAHNFTRLYALFGVRDGPLPPLERRSLVVSLRVGQTDGVALPAGYVATGAQIVVPAVKAGGDEVHGIVGPAPFSVTPGQSTSVTLPSLEGTIPVALTEDSPEPAAAGLARVAAVTIDARPSTRSVRQWQAQAFDALETAAEEQRRRLSASESRLDEENPAAVRQRLREEIRSACAAVLRQCSAEAVAFTDRSSPPRATGDAFRARDRAAVENMLEWSELAYSLGDHLLGVEHRVSQPDPTNLELVRRFLRSEAAEVLVPVRPDSVGRALFFLRAGLLWRGDDRLAPVAEGDPPLFVDLARPGGGDRHCEGPEWTTVVPTSLSVAAPAPSFEDAEED